MHTHLDRTRLTKHLSWRLHWPYWVPVGMSGELVVQAAPVMKVCLFECSAVRPTSLSSWRAH